MGQDFSKHVFTKRHRQTGVQIIKVQVTHTPRSCRILSADEVTQARARNSVTPRFLTACRPATQQIRTYVAVPSILDVGDAGIEKNAANNSNVVHLTVSGRAERRGSQTAGRALQLLSLRASAVGRELQRGAAVLQEEQYDIFSVKHKCQQNDVCRLNDNPSNVELKKTVEFQGRERMSLSCGQGLNRR